MKKDQEGVIEKILMKFLGKSPDKVPLSDVEQRLLNDWLAESEGNRLLFDEVVAGTAVLELSSDIAEAKAAVKENLRQHIPPGRKVIPMSRWVAAAAIVGAIMVVGFLWLKPNGVTRDLADTSVSKELIVTPGKEGAILTLSNGQKIVLEEKDGVIAQQGQSVISDSAGQLAYATALDGSQEGSYNTITTPKGRTYRVVLSDGTKIWLNAESNLRYPASFGGTRNVELEGEAFFDVSHSAARPFTVTVSNGMQVRVLGTMFNVHAYGQEPTAKTTLIRGSVQVTKGNTTQLLRPGQESSVEAQSDKIAVSDLDEEGILAAGQWKDGYFHFREADEQTVGQAVSRWYDLELRVKGNSSDRFNAVIDRNMDVDSLINYLRRSNVRIARQGRTLIIGE